MEKKTDLRVKRTQKHMKAALMELISEKDYRDISVKELSERAEISRATFYLYYDNIGDMVNSVSNELLASITDNVGSIIRKELGFRATCMDIMRHPFASDEDMELFRKLAKCRVIDGDCMRTLIQNIRAELASAFRFEPMDKRLDYIHDFVSAGLTSSVLRWANEDGDSSGYDELAGIIAPLLFGAHSPMPAISRR